MLLTAPPHSGFTRFNFSTCHRLPFESIRIYHSHHTPGGIYVISPCSILKNNGLMSMPRHPHNHIGATEVCGHIPGQYSYRFPTPMRFISIHYPIFFNSKVSLSHLHDCKQRPHFNRRITRAIRLTILWIRKGIMRNYGGFISKSAINY